MNGSHNFSRLIFQVRFLAVPLLGIISWILIAFLLHPQPFSPTLPANLIPGGLRSSPFEAFVLQILQRLFAFDTLARLAVIAAASFIVWQLTINYLMAVKNNLNQKNASHWLAYPLLGLGRSQVILERDSQHIPEENHNTPHTLRFNLICRTKDGIRLRLSNVEALFQASSSLQFADPAAKEIISLELNKCIRSKTILELMETSSSNESNYEKDGMIDTTVDALDLRPDIVQIPNVKPITFKVISIPRTRVNNQNYSPDFGSQILILTNGQLLHQQNITISSVKIISIEKCELEPASAKKKLEAAWKEVSSLPLLNQPGEISRRRVEIQKSIYSDHLQEIESVIKGEKAKDSGSKTLLFYLQYFQKTAESCRFEGEPVPAAVSNLIAYLEKMINTTTGKKEFDNEIF